MNQSWIFELVELLLAMHKYLVLGWLGNPSCRRNGLLRVHQPKEPVNCKLPVLE